MQLNMHSSASTILNPLPWILEGDIRGCFDNISHDWLKANIPLEPSAMTQFLKAGFVFEQVLYPDGQRYSAGGSYFSDSGEHDPRRD
jgi:retron-type reverse transcriptase